MKIFLSYPSAVRDAAETTCYALQAEGHEVFFDREDLPPGESYDERIRDALEASDLFIFIITPESVEPGRYTLSEQKIASRKWPNPTGRVLPVMLEETPFEDIPAYLKAVTILTPEGNASAEILLEVEQLEETAAPARRVKIESIAAELPSLTYRPLEIRFGAVKAGAYPVAITASPAGPQPSKPCALDPDSLDTMLWASARPVRGSVRRGSAELAEEGAVLLPAARDVQRAGQEIHELIFGSHLQDAIDASLRTVDPQRGDGVRFLINTTDAPDLARVPWEFAFSPGEDDFVFSDQMKPVVRWLDVDAPQSTLAVEPPLRLLTAVASPASHPELRVGEELEHLADALQDLADDGLIRVHNLQHATLERLDDALVTFKPHLLHFVGHGDFDGDDGVIVLEDEHPPGGADPITGRRLGVLLRNRLDSLRFVFLNSCLGAAASRLNPFGGVAQSLIRRGVPAVVAMQFPIPDDVAVKLARHFYRYIAAGLPVDAALTSARAFLYAAGHDVEWGAPALHMRTPDGRLFDFPPPSGQATSPTPAPPGEVPSAGSEPKRSEPPPAVARQPRRWPWVLAALVLAAVIALAYLGFALQKSGDVPDDLIPIEGPPDRPTTPSAPTAEDLYGPPLQALVAGDYAEALTLLDAAKREDPDGALLIAAPELRAQLLAGLASAARERIARDDSDSAERLLVAILEIDPSNVEAQAMLAELEPPQTAPQPPSLPESVVREHRVVAGDTLWDIATQAYGDPTRWPEIFAANRDKIANPDLIFPDQALTLPAPRAPATTQTASVHRVQQGDTLWDIAAVTYGNPFLWPGIYEANRGDITDPDLIFPGQELTLPRNPPN